MVVHGAVTLVVGVTVFLFVNQEAGPNRDSVLKSKVSQNLGREKLPLLGMSSNFAGSITL